MKLVIERNGIKIPITLLIEAVVGSRNPELFADFLRMAKNEGVQVDRIIGPMSGLDSCSYGDVRKILQIAKQYSVQIFVPLICPAFGVRDGGKFPIENLGQPEGALFGISHPNNETVEYCLNQVDRMFKNGWEEQLGLLVWDRDFMELLQSESSVNLLPAIKVSIFAGVRSGFAAKWWSHQCVVSINPTAVSARQIAEIRSSVRSDVFIDIHFSTLDSMGGRNLLMEETIEEGVLDFLVAAAPNVVAKFEVGKNISDLIDDTRLKKYVFPGVLEQIKIFRSFMIAMSGR